MSQLDHVQLSSTHFTPTPMFSAFQTLGATTTLPAMPTALAKPAAIAGSVSVNPCGLFDNTRIRATTLILMFAMTAANNVHVAFDVIGFSKIRSIASDLYLPTKFFLGAAEAGNINISTPIGEATAFLADNFSTKTFAGFNIAYIEPADDIGGAMLLCDIRGAEYVTVRLAQGAATAATKAQVYYGVN